MSAGYYHDPPRPVSTRVRCPVCHAEVYSRAGIHPQCAAKRSELPKPKKQTAVVAVPAVQAEGAADQAPAVISDSPDLGITSTPARTAE